MSQQTTEQTEQETANSLRVLDILKEDERPAEQTMGGEEVANRYEVDADALYERGFAIARGLRAWRNYSGEGPRAGLPAPSGLEQAADRVRNLSDDDFDTGYTASVEQVRGEQAIGRARAIEAVRLLVTALIRQQSGGPINLHILSDPATEGRWRLFEAQPALDF